MNPLRRRAVLAPAQWLRANHTRAATGSKPASGPTGDTQLTGSAKLFADAAEEESAPSSSRAHLVNQQGPVWTGDESTHDAVLRMLVDAHKPHRTGEGIPTDASEKRIHNWMKNIDMQARHPVAPVTTSSTEALQDNPHRTRIPPHLHRPWHSTYTGDTAQAHEAKVKYGWIQQKKSKDVDFDNLLELKLPAGIDASKRAKTRDAARSVRLQGRLGRARESAIDYRLGVEDGVVTNVGVENEEHEAFSGNRQIRGASVLGGHKGAASGMRAWGGLVEDRIQKAQKTGYFATIKGRGSPLVRDPAEKNPHLELGEVFMNNIVKRQGALPPWIELQQHLDSTISAFRTLLLDTYSKHIVRNILSINHMDLLPRENELPGKDEAWEARELKFHQENIRQINEQVRKLNTLAPAPARRNLVTLESELDRVRGEVLRREVAEQLERRVKDIRNYEANGRPRSRVFLESLENSAIGRLGQRMSSVGGSGGSDMGHKMFAGGPTADHGDHHSAGGGKGLFVLTAAGVVAVLYFRRPTRNDSAHTGHLIPVKEEAEEPQFFVANSASEKSYTIVELFKDYILEPLLTIVRFIHLALLFGPVILTAPMIFVGSPPRRKAGKPVAEPEDNWGAVWWYGFLVKQMERAGPSFIKLGQWAASRADLFPAVLCTKMSKLHSSNNPHSFRHTKHVIEKAFDLPFDEIFEEFDKTPIGIGAIAQVYRATLRPEIITKSANEAEELTERIEAQAIDDDRRIVTQVAIKVLHPRVDKLVRRDIAIMSMFANAINAFPGMEWISVPEEVQVFGQMMNQQLDLRVEASNLDRFRYNFRDRPNTVTFPRPIRLGENKVAASREVLIEEFEDAIPLKWFLRNGGGPYDEKIANLGLDAFLEMLLLDNWTHGDLHPGNIMVRIVKPETYHIIGPWIKKMRGLEPKKDPNPIPTESISETEMVHELLALKNDKAAWLERLAELDAKGLVPQLVFIDAGLVTSLDGENRRNFLDLFQAVAEFDGYKAGKLMVERCRRPDLTIDDETFALKIQHLVLSVKSKTFSLAKIKISDILNDVLLAVRQHHVKLEGDFVNTVISILLLEGIGRQLDPNMDLFKSALPILRQLGRQLGSREAISHVNTGNLLAMAKLWIWAEARSVVGEASSIDKWIKYDWMAPGV